MTTIVLQQDEPERPDPPAPPRPALGAYANKIEQAKLLIGNNGW
jgi:hypothetical protein